MPSIILGKNAGELAVWRNPGKILENLGDGDAVGQQLLETCRQVWQAVTHR